MPRSVTTGQRGYGWAHQQERAKWRGIVDAGAALCTRCGAPIHPGQPWDLDHRDDRSGYLGAAHRSCNRAAGARKGHRRRRTRSASRSW